MKELKVVEMLQEIAIRLDPFDNKIELALLDGAFAELQELTQEKSCDGCSHSPTTSDNCWHCIRGVKQDHYTPKG